MPTNVVGARELKVRLGTYLRRVRQGQRLIVTDRGQPVAELRPLGDAVGVDAVLARLEANGAVTRPTRKGLASFTPIESHGASLTAAVLADRDDRF